MVLHRCDESKGERDREGDDMRWGRGEAAEEEDEEAEEEEEKGNNKHLFKFQFNLSVPLLRLGVSEVGLHFCLFLQGR